MGLSAAACLLAAAALGQTEERFRSANELARAGDLPAAIAAYREIAASETETASLYWNWAQAAAARGERGEALWALLRARELDPSDRAVRREVERLRAALNLDPAEIAPEPLSGVARVARRFRLELVALALVALSVLFHAALRFRVAPGLAGPAAWTTFLLGLALAAVVGAGSLARPTASVVRRGAPLLDAASPTAEAVGTLREGEVVPVLEASGEWRRVEDNAGARGWAHVDDVWRLDRPPASTAGR
jgi:hypothetical protein